MLTRSVLVPDQSELLRDANHYSVNCYHSNTHSSGQVICVRYGVGRSAGNNEKPTRSPWQHSNQNHGFAAGSVFGSAGLTVSSLASAFWAVFKVGSSSSALRYA